MSHSLFHDDSAAAVTVGEIADWSEPQPSRQTFNNTVADSTITDLPKEFRGAVSLSVFVAAATQLLHKAINGSSYSAITVGWGWHTQLGNTSYARDNRVVGNAISNSLQLLFDGGDICMSQVFELLHLPGRLRLNLGGRVSTHPCAPNAATIVRILMRQTHSAASRAQCWLTTTFAAMAIARRQRRSTMMMARLISQTTATSSS